MNGAAIGEANGRRLDPAKGLTLMGDLNPGRSNRAFDRPRDLNIIGRYATLDMAARQDMDDLSKDLPLDPTSHLEVRAFKGALDGGLGVDECAIQSEALKFEAIDPVIC